MTAPEPVPQPIRSTRSRVQDVPPFPVEPAHLTEHERAVLASVDRYLRDAIAVKAWHARAFAENNFEERFEIARSENRPCTSFGFFGRTEISGKPISVMGNHQEMFYDQPSKIARITDVLHSEWLAQVREFVLHYFMRISSFSQPTAYIDGGMPNPSAYIGGLSWCMPPVRQMEGFGFSQLFCKVRATGQILKFSDSQEFAILDLREISEKYEWVVLKVRIFDFAVRLKPLGPEGPEFTLNLNEGSYIALSPEFIVDEVVTDDSPNGPVARYGFGYAFLRNPEHNDAAYGPGEFEAAFESIRFEVARNGEVTVKMDFVSNRPEHVTAVDVNPARWAFEVTDRLSLGLLSRAFPSARDILPSFGLGRIDPMYAYIALANAVTAGQAGDMMGISREHLDKRFLLQHFTQHYVTLAGSLMTWRQIPDWLDKDNLPRWIVTGGLIHE